MPKKTSIMTAIPYVNSTPHIGNVLTTLSGDITARYMRMRGHDVFFQVGTDENGLKIKEAAEAKGEDVHTFVDAISQRFADIFQSLKISSDAFVRTTEDRHVKACQELFRRLQATGHIYEGTYEGWYDVSTETFFKEEELVDGLSPDGNEVRWVSEQNWFFRLSAFQQPLLDAYADGTLRVVPETRQNEVLSFINQGLRDLCVSRTNPGWGIPLPDDPSKVIYVWFDALINYLTATGWPDAGWEDAWPPVVQWLGKDILTRFHATLWPAMLMGVGAWDGFVTKERPFTVVAHGWILLGADKISKSKGNVVEPLVLAADLAARAGVPEPIAVDALRYYEAATMSFESDSTFTYEDFDRRYNSDLANDLGNALNRSLSMAHKFVGGSVPEGPSLPEAVEAVWSARSAYDQAMTDFRLDRATDAAWGLVRYLNKAIDTWAPWSLAKNGDASLGSVVRSMLLCLRSAEGLVRPLIPDAADAMAAQLGLPPLTAWDQIGDEGSLPAGTALSQPVPIFPRLETKPATAPAPDKKTMEDKPKSEKPKAGPAPVIEFPDFAKVELRVARIIEAERIEGSEKLMKLQVRIGDEPRQIVAGIAKAYAPLDLIGRQIIVVANLKPAKLMGHESQGMLLAADDTDGAPILLQPERESPDGTSVH
ncbi:MAG: methionine--tRNA ligase [Armatimonadetes bacterium]|nr:methionine--tRNA ligase [Armatimonadota bacterium]